MQVCLVGAEDRLFHAGWRPDEPFRVLFVGKLIPLHGVETILEAARLAPELEVRVIGSGQLNGAMDGPAAERRVDRVDRVRRPAARVLGRRLRARESSGRPTRRLRVIPNKAYHALACGAPLITADTPAARELLRDGENALLVPPGDPAALAEAMRRLAADPELGRALSRGGLAVYEEQASEEVLGARWRSLLEELLV